MEDRMIALRERTRRLARTLARLERLWQRIEALPEGARRQGATFLLARALDRSDGGGAESPVGRPLDPRGQSLPGDGAEAGLLGQLGRVDAGFAIDSFEVLVVLCEALVDGELDPFETSPESDWLGDFRHLVRGETDSCQVFSAEFVRRWTSLQQLAAGFDGARRLTFEMAMVRALRGMVAWAIGHRRMPASNRSAGLVLRMGESVLEQAALA